MTFRRTCYNYFMKNENLSTLGKYLDQALKARTTLIGAEHSGALRLFSGFYEGYPNLVVDLYGRTLVLYNYGDSEAVLDTAGEFFLAKLPWVNCVIQKTRSADDITLRRGVVTFGDAPAKKIREHGVWYALELQMNQDASFYLDTRNLRRWLLDNAAGWRVLNTFAYTGSLGVAALAGSADHVVQGDRSHKFLALARKSALLNRFDIGKMETNAVDFYRHVGHFKKSGQLFDCVILDPPFFSTTSHGTVDQINESVRLINKVRPLIKDGGYLIAINNALFLSGAETIQSLEKLSADGYLAIEKLIPVPQDITGYPDTLVGTPPSNPAPFNHPTKIAVLRVRRRA